MHLASTSQGAVNRERLAAFLGEQAALLRFEVAGSTDLTDGTVRGTVDSLARFYGRWTPRQGLDNTSLFLAVSGAARAWTKGRLAHRRTGAVLQGRDRVDLLDHIRATAAQVCVNLGLDPTASRAESVITRVNAFCLKMRRGRRIQNAVTLRPASRAENQQDLDTDVSMALQGLLEGQTAPARTVDEVMSLMKGQKRSAADHLVPLYSRTAVARAVARLRGKPRREAAIAAMRPVVRDLISVIDTDLPASTVSLVSIESLAARLWPPQASKAGKCVHRRRLLDALAEISPALGIHVRVEGKNVLLGRGRRIPAAGPFIDKLRKRAPRILPPGLMPARMGVWGTKAGEVVQAALRVVVSPAHEDDVDVVARALGHPNGAPAMRELAAGGKSDSHWYPTARERPARRRPDPRVRYDVHAWAMRVFDGSECVLADNWSIPDRQAAHSILKVIDAGATDGIPGVLNHFTGQIPDLSLARDDASFLAQDDGEGWRDMQDIARLLDGADWSNWKSVVMDTANAGRPGRRPARTPPLASRPIPSAPPVPQPGPGAARPSGVTIYEAAKPRPKRVPIPLDVLRMMDCRVTKREVAKEWRKIWTEFSDDPIHYLRDVDAGMEALREALTVWSDLYPNLAKMDGLTEGSLRYALKATGILLKAHGGKAAFLASMIMSNVSSALTNSTNNASNLSKLAWQIHHDIDQAFPGTIGKALWHLKRHVTLTT